MLISWFIKIVGNLMGIKTINTIANFYYLLHIVYINIIRVLMKLNMKKIIHFLHIHRMSLANK